MPHSDNDLPSADWCDAFLIGWARDTSHGVAIREVLIGVPIQTVAKATGLCERTLRRWALDARSDLHRAWSERVARCQQMDNAS